jgi:hypothetical protein
MGSSNTDIYHTLENGKMPFKNNPRLLFRPHCIWIDRAEAVFIFFSAAHLIPSRVNFPLLSKRDADERG